MNNDTLKQAGEVVQTASFRQLRRDMRYLRRVMKAHVASNVRDPKGTWHQTYHALHRCEARLHKRYGGGSDGWAVVFRMKGIIIQLDKISQNI